VKIFLSKILVKDFNTTTYLLDSPANAARLLKGIEDYEKSLDIEGAPFLD